MPYMRAPEMRDIVRFRRRASATGTMLVDDPVSNRILTGWPLISPSTTGEALWGSTWNSAVSTRLQSALATPAQESALAAINARQAFPASFTSSPYATPLRVTACSASPVRHYGIERVAVWFSCCMLSSASVSHSAWVWHSRLTSLEPVGAWSRQISPSLVPSAASCVPRGCWA